jgi:hypothetical protein
VPLRGISALHVVRRLTHDWNQRHVLIRYVSPHKHDGVFGKTFTHPHLTLSHNTGNTRLRYELSSQAYDNFIITIRSEVTVNKTILTSMYWRLFTNSLIIDTRTSVQNKSDLTTFVGISGKRLLALHSWVSQFAVCYATRKILYMC